MPSTYVESVKTNTHIVNLGISEKEQAILKHLATKGPAWYYELSEKQKIASNKTVLKSLANLQKKELIQVDRAESYVKGRKRKFYGLTFKGLVIAIKKGLIEPSKAWDVKRKYGIEISCNRNCGRYGNETGECSEVKDFMERQPEAFFKVLSSLPNILEIPQDVLSKYTCFAAMLGAFYLFLTDPEFYKQVCLEVRTLEFGCAGIADPGPPENAEAHMMMIVRPLLNILGFDIPKTPPCNIEEDNLD